MPAIERVILIDDNESDNVYHEIMIRRSGFAGEIVAFENGVDGLHYLETTDLDRPTYIFLDINMPMMDGFEVAERAAPLLENHRAVIVAMLTSSASPHDRERAGKLEIVHGFITKPLRVDAIRELLDDSF